MALVVAAVFFIRKFGTEPIPASTSETKPQTTQKETELPTQTEEGVVPEAEYMTESETEPDAAVTKKEGIWVLLGCGDGEEKEAVFSSVSPYIYQKSLSSEQAYEVSFYNFGDSETQISLLMTEEDAEDTGTEIETETYADFTIGGIVGAGERVDLPLPVSTDADYTLSVVLRSGEETIAYIGSEAGLICLCDTVLEDTDENLTVCMYGGLSEYEDSLERLPVRTNLVWDRSAPDMEEIALCCNVTTYNGEDMSVCAYGGVGTAYISEAWLNTEQNSWLTSSIQVGVSGNTMQALVPYYVNEASMHSANISVTVEGGSVYFTGEGLNGDGTIDLLKESRCVVTDADGNTRIYQLTGGRLAHNLPIVYMTTSTGAEVASAYTYITGTFSMDANGVEGAHDIETQTIQVRGRGNSTWTRWPKHGMKIVFEEKQNLIGDLKDRDWAMLANYYDRTMLRNELAFELADHLEHLEYTPEYQLVDVFLNGSYYGVYDLGGTIEVGKNNVDIQLDTNAEDSGFLVEIGGSGKKSTIYSGSLSNVEIHDPSPVTDAQYNYIANYLAQTNAAIVNHTNYKDYIDVDSFIDWLILEEFCYNWDAAYIRNVYMYKEPGGKLKFGPVWDFDLSMGSVGYQDWTYQDWATSQNGLVGVTWTTYMLEDPAFMERLKARWLEKRDELMQAVDDFFEEEYAILNPSWEENHWRWMADKDGVNIQWEWIFEYEGTTLEHYINYTQSIFDYRYQFLNRTLVDGWICPAKPLKTDSESAGAEDEADDE